jgi:hypothetical protein
MRGTYAMAAVTVVTTACFSLQRVDAFIGAGVKGGYLSVQACMSHCAGLSSGLSSYLNIGAFPS